VTGRDLSLLFNSFSTIATSLRRSMVEYIVAITKRVGADPPAFRLADIRPSFYNREIISKQKGQARGLAPTLRH